VKELSGKRFLLYLSRIHEKKGCDNLIRAFAHLAKKDSEILLAFVGPDPTNWIPELKGIAESLGISDRVLWPGMLTGDDKWGAFMAAEAFVLPSHQENFGIVVAEALASGTPVLISNKVNIWREIQAAGAGIVEDDTLEGTVRLLESWSKLTDLERRDMAEKAKSCFLQNFEIKAAVESLLQVTRHGRDIP
jgi:glycosyltransferase involved in cell wall biosynthesis